MADLEITPDYLDTLARNQDEAAAHAKTAAGAGSGLVGGVWLTHGVAPSYFNVMLGIALKHREEIGSDVYKSATRLAESLRDASKVYAGVDEELGRSLDAQVLPK